MVINVAGAGALFPTKIHSAELKEMGTVCMCLLFPATFEDFMRTRFILATALLFLPLPASAMTDEQCATMWKGADTNNDNVLSGAEAERYSAWMRVKNNQVGDSLDQKTFLENCRADVFAERTVDDGAPLKGANSFTEAQAKDWILSAGFSGVSALEKDSDGIWRGSAMKNGTSMQVAVDYRGNVVAK